MELLALLSTDDELIIPQVKEALQGYTVYPVKSGEELEDLLINIPLNLFFIDTGSHRLSSIEGLLRKLHEDTVVLITPEKLDKFIMDNLPSSVFNCVVVNSIKTELPIISELALERQRYKNELALIRQSKKEFPSAEKISRTAGLEGIAGRPDALPSGKYFQEKVLVNFAKMLTVSFDMKKLLHHFMDSVMGIARVNRMSVMLRDEEGFSVNVQYGLDQYLAENLRLKKDSALAIWLVRTGGITQKPISPIDSASINIKSEMELLQCSYSFPLIHKGKLTGIFNIGNKITEEPFYKDELEMIYLFCSYLAAAAKDISLYHQIWYQKEFTKNILSSMNTGVIAIDKDEKITVLNHRAAEILNVNVEKMIGRDLRSLPSPLGDFLYETMVTGTAYKRYEVEVGPDKVPLGINSCRFIDKNQTPIGAGLIFTDLSDSKKLEEQKRKADKLEAINNLVGKIAHEVRTPLTSIQTYTQILSEKYGRDEDLQKFFSSTVLNSIRTLDSLIDKLVIFSSAPEYNFMKEEVNSVLNEASDYISKNIPEGYKFLNQGIERSIDINVDKKLLIKAIYYLIMCIIDRTKEEIFITMSGRVMMQNPPQIEILIKYTGAAITEEEKKNLLKPILDIDTLGTELNMPLSHKIIEAHNGTINIKSENGTNTFMITLPTIDRRSKIVSSEDKAIEHD
jgi:nitrogen-specific signal transduction histidine kinase